MNHDEILPIDPELEARIVAWVLGEASAFEAAELERHLAERPELAVFKRRIEAVHGLVGEAARPSGSGPRLSAERRAKLLATIGAETPPDLTVTALRPLRTKPWWRVPTWLGSVAACLLVGVVLVDLFVPHFGLVRPKFAQESEMRQRAKPDELMVMEGVVDSERGDTAARRKAVAAAMRAPEKRKREQASVADMADLQLRSSDVPAVTASTEVRAGFLLKNTDIAIHTSEDRLTQEQAKRLEELRERQRVRLSENRKAVPVVSMLSPQAAPAEPTDARPASRPPEEMLNGFATLDAFTVETRRDAGYAAGQSMDGMRISPPAVAADVPQEKLTLPDFSREAERTYVASANEASVQSAPGSNRNDTAFRWGGGAVGGKQQYVNAPVTFYGTASVPAATLGAVAAARGNTAVATNSVGGASANQLNQAFSNQSVIAGSLSVGGMITPSLGTGGLVVNQSQNVVASDEFKDARPMRPEPTATNYAAIRDGGGVVADNNTGEVVTLSAFSVSDNKKTAANGRAKVQSAPAKAEREVASPAPVELATVEADRPVIHAEPAIDESLRAEVPTQAQPSSTFSLHVSDVSFRLAQAALDRGEMPDPASIRPEEFYNAFDYGDPSPVTGEPVACRVEQSAAPFLQQRNLVRIAMKVPATGRGAGQPLHLTVLLDTSGSMEREDRVTTIRRALTVLASLLGPDDRVTLIGFARQPRLLAERVPGNQASTWVEIATHTPAEGGTNLEEALKLAGEQARAQFQATAQNRIVVLTDGAANLGNDDPARLAAQVVALRQEGIAFDACGIGVAGLDDSVLEALTRKGAGRYYVINSPEEADAGFAHKLAGAFHPAAENVKVQVRFNPARVQAYRLIGFEQHRLRTEDFRNDKVEAAELAAEEAAVALYQVQVRPDGEGEIGDVFVRFRNAATGEMVERSWTLTYAPQAPAFDQASPSLQLAGTAAYLAEKLRGGAPAATIRLSELAPTVNRLRAFYSHDARVQQLVAMFGQARRLLND